QKHGYSNLVAYHVSETFPIRIRPGYGQDTYPRRFRVSKNKWAENSDLETFWPNFDTAQPT
ncbi:unnamed protein product, partial [Urochloa humidicola]